MDSLFQDVRFAIRGLLRQPGFTAGVVLLLAIAIGANVAMFSAFHEALIRPLPYAEPDRLILGRATFNGNMNPDMSAYDYFDYRERNGKPIPYSRWNRKRADGPSEIIATPVVHNDRIYVAIGQSPIHGPGQGMLTCIDGASGRRIWETREVGRTLSDVAIHDGLLYISDYGGLLHCLDADTGGYVWRHEMGSGVWTASPTVADGKVYIGDEDGDVAVLKQGKKLELLHETNLGSSVYTTPVAHDGVLYIVTRRKLFAVEEGIAPKTPAATKKARL